MKVLIIEDEKPAVEKLEIFLQRYDAEIIILNKIDSVKKSIAWLHENGDQPDLIFMDIQLTDGESFEIFKEVKVSKPIIFITAYNEYAIEAFKVNSIDYLLKPISYEDFSNSLKKLENLKKNLGAPSPNINFEQLGQLLQQNNSEQYKDRFMIKVGEHLKSITSENIAMFYAEGRNVSLVTTTGRQYIVDYILEELQKMLNPLTYFRVSRTFIVNINAIKDVIVYSSSRLKILLEHEFEKEIIVSREKVNDFKNWFDGER